MTPPVALHIGGVTFKRSSPQQEPPYPINAQASYRAFYRTGAAGESGGVIVPVEVEWAELPSVASYGKMFDSGQSWRIYRDGAAYVLSFHPRPFPHPLWLARFDPGVERVVVTCSPDFRDDPLRYPLDQLLLMYVLARHDGLVIHGAGIACRGQGYLFAGPSGAGKSTLSRLCLDRPDLEVVNDDRMVVRSLGGQKWLYGTPWPGEAGIALDKRCPLKGLFFLEHGPENRVRPLKKAEAVERLLPVTSVPWYDRAVMPLVLQSCDELVTSVPCGMLSFTPGPGAAELIRDLPGSGGPFPK